MFHLRTNCTFKDLSQRRRWLTDSNSLFCLQQQKSKQKNAAPLIKLSLKSNESTLVSRNIYSCCGTREKSFRSDILAESHVNIASSSACLNGEGEIKFKFENKLLKASACSVLTYAMLKTRLCHCCKNRIIKNKALYDIFSA